MGYLHDAPLLAVALIVFGGVFAYLWRLDSRVSSVESELREELALERRDAGPGK